jgi:hypothetical protein
MREDPYATWCDRTGVPEALHQLQLGGRLHDCGVVFFFIIILTHLSPLRKRN